MSELEGHFPWISNARLFCDCGWNMPYATSRDWWRHVRMVTGTGSKQEFTPTDVLAERMRRLSQRTRERVHRFREEMDDPH